MVAAEQYTPIEERIFTDPLAEQMLPLRFRWWLPLLRISPLRNAYMRYSEREAPELWSRVMIRKRYIEDLLLEAIPDMEAVVVLGGGYDPVLYRLLGDGQLPGWDVDHAVNIAIKTDSALRAFHRSYGHIHLVSADLEQDDLTDPLGEAGYDPTLKTFFIFEGVSMYLSPTGNERVFRFLSSVAPGSQLVMTTIARDFIEGRNKFGFEKSYDRMVGSRIWRSGFDRADLPPYLARFGWEESSFIEFEELREQYVPPKRYAQIVSQFSGIVHAKKLP